jgi:hypothetical protein
LPEPTRHPFQPLTPARVPKNIRRWFSRTDYMDQSFRFA